MSDHNDQTSTVNPSTSTLQFSSTCNGCFVASGRFLPSPLRGTPAPPVSRLNHVTKAGEDESTDRVDRPGAVPPTTSPLRSVVPVPLARYAEPEV